VSRHASAPAWDEPRDFLEAYRREVVALARTVPGYRGYQILTSFSPYESEGAPTPQFARRNPGQKFPDHLSRVQYPFVSNVWDAMCRMVKNSLSDVPEGGTAPVAAILEH
jgi:hypothetical protein